MSKFKRLLLLPHLKVHNANALSSPFTIGFPAMTAWLGAVHALQRKLNASGFTRLNLMPPQLSATNVIYKRIKGMVTLFIPLSVQVIH